MNANCFAPINNFTKSQEILTNFRSNLDRKPSSACIEKNPNELKSLIHDIRNKETQMINHVYNKLSGHNSTILPSVIQHINYDAVFSATLHPAICFTKLLQFVPWSPLCFWEDWWRFRQEMKYNIKRTGHNWHRLLVSVLLEVYN